MFYAAVTDYHNRWQHAFIPSVLEVGNTKSVSLAVKDQWGCTPPGSGTINVLTFPSFYYTYFNKYCNVSQARNVTKYMAEDNI